MKSPLDMKESSSFNMKELADKVNILYLKEQNRKAQQQLAAVIPPLTLEKSVFITRWHKKQINVGALPEAFFMQQQPRETATSPTPSNSPRITSFMPT